MKIQNSAFDVLQNVHGNAMSDKDNTPVSIELFIEDQAFSPSYDLAPPPPLSTQL